MLDHGELDPVEDAVGGDTSAGPAAVRGRYAGAETPRSAVAGKRAAEKGVVAQASVVTNDAWGTGHKTSSSLGSS